MLAQEHDSRVKIKIKRTPILSPTANPNTTEQNNLLVIFLCHESWQIIVLCTRVFLIQRSHLPLLLFWFYILYFDFSLPAVVNKFNSLVKARQFSKPQPKIYKTDTILCWYTVYLWQNGLLPSFVLLCFCLILWRHMYGYFEIINFVRKQKELPILTFYLF